MKKYLITGALALVACATLTSCHSDDELSGSLVEQKLQTYEQVFKQEFGEVNPNQDWGFGTAESLARTRAEGENFDPTTHVGAYTDGNMWTSKGFLAPDPLTEGQKLRVQYYFQMNKITNPNQPNYGTINFFMQQVYDGGDDPMTKYKEGNYSPEVYEDAGGNTITSGQHMDHLTAGPGHLHINNFNNSTCGWYENVANWDQTNVNDESQQHRDQIELMLNTPTSCFGYANSNDTEVYDDQWTLVAGSVIDNFCDVVDPDGWAEFLAAHSGVTDKAVVDKWNRSFIGFDFKLMPDPDPIKKENGVTVTAKYGDADGSQWGYAYNGTEVVSYSDNNAEILINNQPISVVIDNLNFFAAKNIKGVGGQDNHNDFDTYKDFVPGGANDDCLYLKKHTQGVQDDHVALNLKFIKRMVDDGFLPVYGKHLKLWVKVSDLTDGYYTDWIVSFMPANSGNIIIPKTDEIDIEQGNESSYERRTYKQLRYITKFNQNGRIMCEDLGTSSISDIDFNDIVFDAWMYNMVPQIRTKIVKFEGGKVTEIIKDYSENNDDWVDAPSEYNNLIYTITDIYLLAGGGTIPANVAGVSLKNAFGTDNKNLVNTVDERDPDNIKRYGNPYKKLGWKQPEELRGIKGLKSFNDIDVVVEYNNSPVPLKSEKGKVPHKICVPIETKWPYERIVINEAYDFNRYVKEGSTITFDETDADKIENSKGEVIGYYFNERNRKVGDDNVWTKDPDDVNKNETKSRYHGSIDYEGDGDITGIPYRDNARVIGSTTDPKDLEGYEVETVSSGSSSGYKGGNDPDPVLIRVRH